jgi:hypothetical protein
VHAAAVPLVVTMVLALFTQAVCRAVQALAGSQVSPRSTTPLPQLGAQSLSLLALQPDGQQPSLLAQAVCMPAFTHATLHIAAVPVRLRSWQPIAGQVVGQLPSQVSPLSTMPLPQRTAQSASVVLLQVLGQQASPAVHAVVTVVFTQCASQLAALPWSMRC